jgi:DNA-binding transcriptional LysR family regulator
MLEVELQLLDRIVDLVEEGIDIGVRIAHLPASSLIAVPVGATRRVVCAAPAYLRKAGTPQTPADLAAHRCIAFTGLGQSRDWTLGSERSEQVAIRPILTTNQVDAALEACVGGVGCGQFLSYQVQPALATGHLKRLLVAFEPAAVPIQLVYPHGRHLSANVRAFIDFAAPRLRRQGHAFDGRHRRSTTSLR